ncbi:dockerin type I repeat-containing protein [Desulfococcaceae bacterium HSG8]|nr:dockerin type I repeat-containing protein [Desulfococcaceae bacterium HSG8]
MKLNKLIYLAMLTVLGTLFIPRTGAEASPVISSVSETQTLYGKYTAAELWAEVIPENEDKEISRVWAEIIPPLPVSEPPVAELQDSDNDNIYTGIYEGFTEEGKYRIFIKAEDTEGDISSSQTMVIREPDADDYEEDDIPEQANIIVLNKKTPQEHNFHKQGDEDWLKFYGLKGESYVVKVIDPEPDCDIVIELYEANSAAALENSADDDEYLLLKDGIHYVKLSNDNPDKYGEFTGYKVEVILKKMPEAVLFTGTVTNAFSRIPLGDVMLKTSQNYSALSEGDDGSYTMYHSALGEADSYPDNAPVTMTAMFPGYEMFQRLVFMTTEGFKVLPESEDTGSGTPERTPSKSKKDTDVNAADLVRWDGIIEMVPLLGLGDINGDDNVDLKDAVIALQVLVSADTKEPVRSDYGESGADVNGDARVGTEEVIHILQYSAILR